jgi:signal transduction histidine kinase
LIIGDNGRGFDVDASRASTQRGLTNLRSRAEAAGGRLTLVSEPGAGTRMEATIPVPSEGKDALDAGSLSQ